MRHLDNDAVHVGSIALRNYCGGVTNTLNR